MPYVVLLKKDSHPDSDQHRNLSSSRGSAFAHACQFLAISINAFVFYLADTLTHTRRHTE